MNFFRRLTAEVPGELLAVQVAATSRHAEATTDPTDWEPAPEYPEIWAAIAAGNRCGIDHSTSAQPAHAGTTEGEH